MNALALPTTVLDIVEEYEAKVAAVDAAIADFKEAHDRMQFATVVHGIYVEKMVDSFYIRPDAIRLNLRKSGWKAVYSRLQIDQLASAKDKRLFTQTLTDPPELTMDNAKATFGDYLLRPRFHRLRALAECFVQLDPAYKSHSRVKIGVSGLPKRVILTSFKGQTSWGWDRFLDILNAIAAVEGKAPVDREELRPLNEMCGGLFGNRAGTASLRGVEVRIFQNGNAHVIFEPPTLLTINRALAEFYGEVLPDVEDDDAPKRAETEVAKDLQFYPTPLAVIRTILDEVGLHPLDAYRNIVKTVLEPSCGDGRMMEAIRERGHRVGGVEVDPGRAEQAKRKGLAVICTNFLEMAANPVYDVIVMNPPFYGKHYRKHIDHARRFLRPSGLLVSVLPASAWYDHGGLRGKWHDLPVASFAESGTNIPTGFIIMTAKDPS